MVQSIYLKTLIDKNVGPISDIHIDFPFTDDGKPKPVLLVGENGTGKSTILSNIVDAFFEMAGRAFTNANHINDKRGYQYFKMISPSEIHIGTAYMYSYITFKADTEIEYVFKAGETSAEEIKNKINDHAIINILSKNGNTKAILANEKLISNIWEKNVICFFAPDRYEKPFWIGDKYYDEHLLHPSIQKNFDGILKNPIIVHDVTSSNLQWLLDVIADSRADIEGNPTSMHLANYLSPSELFLLKQARSNLETILSNIIGEEVYFQLNYRNEGGSRFKIISKKKGEIICPSLDSLSTGQIALFNLFATIVRYADNNNINQSFHLKDITGIVIIDEIELHLHAKLQKEVLPILLKLFPRVQFIITTHAPLFLIGMKETFGEDCFEVLELPTATRISTEKFKEFQKAYEYIKETETYQQDVERVLNSIQSHGKAVIITEGPTDWKHLKAAYEMLNADGIHKALFDDLDFDFFEYEAKNSKEEAEHKLDMGNTVLRLLCENMAKLPQPVKYIFIADRDNDDTNKKMSIEGKMYKDWGNNVFSFILPIPPHRTATPAISIEHYYTDNEIKTEWKNPNTGTVHRLFMGNEFDERGIAQSINKFCEKKEKCGPSSIAIIEGSSGEKVTSISDNHGINYALPKSQFAKMILSKQAPFDEFKFESFIPIFEVIKSILEAHDEKPNI